MALPAQRELIRVSHDWDAWRRETATHALDALRHGLDDAIARMTIDTRAALDAPRDRARAFGTLSRYVGSNDERGIVLYQGDSALAWGGVIRPPLDPSRDGVSIVATQFYLAIQLVQVRGNRRAIEVTLLDAAPPADRLSHPLTRDIAERSRLDGFSFAPPSDSGTGPILHYGAAGNPMFDVRAAPLVQDEMSQRIIESTRARAGLAFVAALAFFVIGVWRSTRRLTHRVASLAIGLACTALLPLAQYSNLTRLFDPAFYFTPEGGPLTGNAGALLTTSALVLLGVLAVFRRQMQRVSRWAAIATVVLVAVLGPFLLRNLARGVQIPLNGAGARLWLIWEVPLFLAATSVLLAGAAAGATVVGPRRGLPAWVAPAAAAIAAALAPIVWEAPGRWPWWYTFLWIGAIALLAFSRRSRAVIISVSAVAALGATTLVWGRTSRGRVDAAVRDLEGLSQVDSVSVTLLRRFGVGLASDLAPTTRETLLKRYVQSEIAAAGNPVALFAWPTDVRPAASFMTAVIPVPIAEVQRIVVEARRSRATIIEAVPTDTAVVLVMAAPSPDGNVTAAVMAPKSRLFEADPFARLLGLDVGADVEPPYTVRLRERAPTAAVTGVIQWRRDPPTTLHGDWVVRTGTGASEAHVDVELRPTSALIQRGALLVLLNLAIVQALWLASVIADGGGGRWLRARRRTWGRSYRARISLALFVFFVIPAAAFAISSYRQLATDTTQSRSLLVRETLRSLGVPPNAPAWLPAEADRLDAPLFLYYGGQLREASDPLYEDIAPTGRFLDRQTEVSLTVQSEATDTRIQPVGAGAMLFGFRSFTDAGLPSVVISTPARASELALDRRRRDLSVLVAFATAVGALAALWLSGLAARELSRPIGTLREAALAIAGGSRVPPLQTEPTVEFNPVFTAFRRMAADLNASRSALEEAQRRTSTVLRNVASGVVAVDLDGSVSLANPRAEQLLGQPLPPGTPFTTAAPPELAEVVQRFLMSTDEEENSELAARGHQLRCSVTRLVRGGAVVTLDDVTELARAQRVLAWGEMARQVAHEIKNPLTPIRLGVQHLRRARADSRVDFDRVLEHNVNQILAEIDRLDEIARAFSRYGAAPSERPRAEAIDVAAVVREVVSLERMGAESGVEWEEEGVDVPVRAMALGAELKEVLLNVLENARLAAAKKVCASVSLLEDGDGGGRVIITVRDDGHGIPADVLPRIFEPHFSTRTSGSGLGLAISRQLVEGWGGSITVDSAAGRGTTVEVRLREATRSRSAAPSRSPAPELS